MAVYQDLTFVQALGDGGPRPVTQVLVTHATDNTASAAAEASYARTRPDKTSAHFYSDEAEVIQAVDLDHIAYGCLYHGNRISIQLELVGLSNQISDATMRKAAPIVARVCADEGIPVRKITAAEVAAGVKGICGHGDITAAFPQDNGDHTDPGEAFPWSTFIGYVQAAGAATSTGGGDMPQDSGDLGPGFAFDEQGNWLDQGKALVVPLPAVGQWGPAWLYVSAPLDVVVRHGSLISGAYHDWADAHPGLLSAAGPVGLSTGTTAVLLGRRKASPTDAADSAPVRWRIQYGS